MLEHVLLHSLQLTYKELAQIQLYQNYYELKRLFYRLQRTLDMQLTTVATKKHSASNPKDAPLTGLDRDIAFLILHRQIIGIYSIDLKMQARNYQPNIYTPKICKTNYFLKKPPFC